MDNNTVGTRNRNWLSEGIIIGTAPVFVYAVTLTYEKGFVDYFGMPNQLISPNITTIFTAGFVLLGILLSVFAIGDAVYSFIPRNDFLTMRLKWLFPVFFLLIIYIKMFGQNWKEWIAVLMVLVGILFFQCVFPLITQRKTKGYLNKLEAQDKVDREFPSMLEPMVEFIGVGALKMVLIIAFIIFFAYGAGKASAIKQQEFLVIHGNPDKVVLRIYGDNLVVAQISENPKKVLRVYSIIKSTETGVVLSKEKVGPLSLEDK